MKQTLSYAAKIVNKNKPLKGSIFATIKIYRSAIKFVLKILDDEYLDLKNLKSKEQNKSFREINQILKKSKSLESIK